MSFPAPFDHYQGEVLPEWIDANGHMNLAYYVVLFDYATDALFDAIGIGRVYKDATNHGTFVAESAADRGAVQSRRAVAVVRHGAELQE